MYTYTSQLQHTLSGKLPQIAILLQHTWHMIHHTVPENKV